MTGTVTRLRKRGVGAKLDGRPNRGDPFQILRNGQVLAQMTVRKVAGDEVRLNYADPTDAPSMVVQLGDSVQSA